MVVGISLDNLAAAVANAGGIGGLLEQLESFFLKDEKL